MGVYEVVPHPKARKVVGSKWMLCKKRDFGGEIQNYKARVVAQGFTQIVGVDYDEALVLVAKFAPPLSCDPAPSCRARPRSPTYGRQVSLLEWGA